MDDNRGYVNWQSLRAYVLDRFFLCLQVDDSEDDEMMGVDEAASQEGDTDEDELHDEYETVRYYIFPVTSQQTAQQTQNICITFVQRWSTTLYKCHTDVLCLLGDNVISSRRHRRWAKGAMDSTSVFFLPLLLPITLWENKLG